MWKTVSVLILSVELVLIGSFIAGRFHRKKLNETALYLAAVFAVSLSLYLVPFLYRKQETGNIIFEILECFGRAIKLFVGEADTDAVVEFATAEPVFTLSYLFGMALAVLTTVSTAVEAFHDALKNGFRLSKAMKQSHCDMVVGAGEKALQYAKNSGAVLLLDESVSKEKTVEMMNEGYTVLRRGFTVNFLKSLYFNRQTQYNLVCLEEEKALSYIDTFLAYQADGCADRHIHLYVEVEESKNQTIRREIIEKSGYGAKITTFCTNELLARTLAEENPITRFLPRPMIEKAAIKPEVRLNILLLGHGNLSKQLYRQFILNNQLVTFDGGTYRLLPVHYFLFDTQAQASDWNIGGLKEALEELNPAEHFPMPEMPFDTVLFPVAPESREALRTVCKEISRPDSYSLVVVDTPDDCRNIELGARLRSLLVGQENYHIFVRSKAEFTEDDAVISYFGRTEPILTHDILVGDDFSAMAKKLNEIYTAQYESGEKARPDFARYIRKKAEEDWQKMDHFIRYSNICAAMSLRVKLNLLGLTYMNDGKGENIEQIAQHYPRNGTEEYSEYFSQSVRNALLAQEHARWNAYHLLQEWLPMEKSGIRRKAADGGNPRFIVKNQEAKKHACLTSYAGLHALSSLLAEQAGNGATAADYDYYVYDEMLMCSAEELLRTLGYSVSEL